MSDFRYSDNRASLPDLTTAEEYGDAHDPNKGNLALEQALQYLRSQYGEDDLQLMSVLDIGCGDGRLMPRFSAQFSSVTGLEPDEDLCDKAMDLILDQELENATALCMDLEHYVKEFPGQKFDIVFCGHVLQHIKHETACCILEGLKNVLHPDSVCLFLTTFTDGRRNVYHAEFLQDEPYAMLETDEKGFDDAVDAEDKLAVCLYARPWMERFLSSCGLETRLFWTAQDAAVQTAATEALYICEPAEGTLLRQSCGPETASGKVCFMRSYSLPAGDSINTGLFHRLKQEESEDVAEIRHAFETAERFFAKKDAGSQVIRHFLKPEIRCRKAQIADSHLIVSVYPEVRSAQVGVCLTLEDVPCDAFVYLHQIQSRRERFFMVDGAFSSISELCEDVLKQCGLRAFSQNAASVITELNRFGAATDPLSLSEEDQRCLYGMLTGDEGYLYLPTSLVDEQFACSWTNRAFARVIALRNSFLLLNFNRGETYADYIDYQIPFAEHYFGKADAYYTTEAPTAGIDHGLFFSVESGLLMQTLTDSSASVSGERSDLPTEDIGQSRRLRSRLIRALNELDRTELSEPDDMDKLVWYNLDIPDKVLAVYRHLEQVDSWLALLYKHATHRMLTCLTILGLLFAILQTLNIFL